MNPGGLQAMGTVSPTVAETKKKVVDKAPVGTITNTYGNLLLANPGGLRPMTLPNGRSTLAPRPTGVNLNNYANLISRPPGYAVGGTVGSPRAVTSSADRDYLNQMKAYSGAATKYQTNSNAYYGMLRDAEGNPVIGAMMGGAPAGSYNMGFFTNTPANSLHDLSGISGYNMPLYQMSANNVRSTTIGGQSVDNTDPRYEAAKAWATANNINPNMVGYFTQNIEAITGKGGPAYVTAYDYNKGLDWGTQMKAPITPTSPINPVTGKEYSEDEAKARVGAIKRDVSNKQMALNVAQDPASYGLSMGKIFNQGGIVQRAEGSPMGGENADHLTPQEIERMAAAQSPAYMTPSSGRGRQAGNISQALNSGEAYPAMARGVAETPYNLVGAPVDLATMAMRPFGYKEEKPVMGSEWIKEKMTKLGIRPGEEANPTLQGFRTAAELGSSLINPAAPVRAAVRTAEKVGNTAAEMMGAFRKPKEAPIPEVTPAVQTELAQLNVDRQYPRDFTQPPNPWMGVAPTLEEARANVATRQAAGAPPPLPEAPPVMPEVTPVAPPMQAEIPADRPFVGRLDAFVDTLKGPVQLGQLKGQLKGKFRDYDVERVERAFAGMEDKAKLTPDQIKQALAETHSPSKWITETLPPKAGAYHQSVDNVWGAPLGTTNLYVEQTAEKIAAGDLFNKANKNLSPFVNNSQMYPTPTHLEEARNLLKDPQLTSLVPAELVSNLQTKFDKVEKNIGLVKDLQGEIKNIEYGLTRPVLYKDPAAAQGAHGDQPWFRFKDEVLAQKKAEIEQQLIAQGVSPQRAQLGYYEYVNAGNNREVLSTQAEKIASQKVQELALARARENGIPEPDVSLIDWDTASVMGPADNSPAFKESLKNALEPSIQTIHGAVKNIQRVVNDDVKKIGDILFKGKMYEGRHANVAGKPYPVGFTRFSEHEATIPDIGVVQGRHFHELQSDLSRDMRKFGTTSGSVEKDSAEYNKLQGELRQAQQKTMDELQKLQAQKRTLTQDGGFNVADLTRIEEEEKAARSALDKGTQAMEKRISILGARVRDKAPYSLDEPFAGFETNQMVRQQLLMKNAIQSAMRDGKRFATFPGAESTQPKLYVNKVEPNLKQVIKDFGGKGSGLELRQIELPPDKDGTPITATGVVWSPEAAARIMKTGVPFAKGGSVDKSNTDYRAYI